MISGRLPVVSALVVALAAPLAAHDLFFRMQAYFVAADATVTVPVLNGTFSRSENGVTRDRLDDLSLMLASGRRSIPAASWSEKDPSSTVTFTTGAAGTYVLGAAVKPRVLSMKGEDFNKYLAEEGIDQLLAARNSAGTLAQPSKERYAKFVKAVFQVGDTRTDSYRSAFGHAAEIVPQANPYELRPGDELTLACLIDGQPLANYRVFAGGRRGETDVRLPQQSLTTDAAGLARVKLTAAGKWYVKFVHMREVNDTEVQYESRWATLTFAVR